MAKFGLIGAGYIHQRHVRAIDNLGHELVIGFDPSSDSVMLRERELAIINEEEQFFSQLKEKQVEWVSICSPSNVHCRQIVKSLQLGCNVIVEKPVCLSVSELNKIRNIEEETGRKVFTIFQLRYHPNVSFINDWKKKMNEVSIIYQGKRNAGYFQSWKGNINESGGIVSAVGIHYFDLLTHYFGDFTDKLEIDMLEPKKSSGWLGLENASVEWNFEFFNQSAEVELKRTFTINGHSLDLSTYAESLHTHAYEQIFQGNGISTFEAGKSLAIVEKINELKKR